MKDNLNKIKYNNINHQELIILNIFKKLVQYKNNLKSDLHIINHNLV